MFGVDVASVTLLNSSRKLVIGVDPDLVWMVTPFNLPSVDLLNPFNHSCPWSYLRLSATRFGSLTGGSDTGPRITVDRKYSLGSW